MGATTPIMVLQGVSGQTYTLGLYFAGGDAVGYQVPCTFNGVATANSSKDFTLPEPCVIKHISGPATGRVQIEANGIPTPIQIDTAVAIAQIANPSARWGQLRGGPSVRYALRVSVAMAA